jgi:hypothetical protein
MARGPPSGEQWRWSSVGRHFTSTTSMVDSTQPLLGLLSLDPLEEGQLGSPAEEFEPTGHLAQSPRAQPPELVPVVGHGSSAWPASAGEASPPAVALCR